MAPSSRQKGTSMKRRSLRAIFKAVEGASLKMKSLSAIFKTKKGASLKRGSLSTIFEAKKRKLEEEELACNSNKRHHTSSPVPELYSERLNELILYKNRLKYTKLYPEEFIPSELFQKFDKLSPSYKAIIENNSFVNEIDESSSEEEVTTLIEEFKNLLIHSVVRTRENNWVSITQVEAYYHSKKIDDVAQYNPRNKYPEFFSVDFKQRKEGKGIWYELRFRFKKLEMIATGGLYGNNNPESNLGSFFRRHITVINVTFAHLPCGHPRHVFECFGNYKKSASLKEKTGASSHRSSRTGFE